MNPLSLLTAATPAWLSLCLVAACAALAWQLRNTVRRLDRHAKSIAHMDEWADSVDHTLARLEERARRVPPAAAATPRSAADLRKGWQK